MLLIFDKALFFKSHNYFAGNIPAEKSGLCGYIQYLHCCSQLLQNVTCGHTVKYF